MQADHTRLIRKPPMIPNGMATCVATDRISEYAKTEPSTGQLRSARIAPRENASRYIFNVARIASTASSGVSTGGLYRARPWMVNAAHELRARKSRRCELLYSRLTPRRCRNRVNPMRWIVTVLWVTALFAARPVHAGVVPGMIDEFEITTANSNAFAIVTGPDGNLWFTERDTNRIARITPAGMIMEFPVTTPTAHPYGITPGPQ